MAKQKQEEQEAQEEIRRELREGKILERISGELAPVSCNRLDFGASPETVVRYNPLKREKTFPNTSETRCFIFSKHLPQSIEGHFFTLSEVYFPGNDLGTPDRQHLNVRFHKPSDFYSAKYNIVEFALQKISRKGMSRALQQQLPEMIAHLVRGEPYHCKVGSWKKLVANRYEEVMPKVERLRKLYQEADKE